MYIHNKQLSTAADAKDIKNAAEKKLSKQTDDERTRMKRRLRK